VSSSLFFPYFVAPYSDSTKVIRAPDSSKFLVRGCHVPVRSYESSCGKSDSPDQLTVYKLAIAET
jgi:hypothetical protein